MTPLHSRGSPTKGSKIRMGCLGGAFAGAQKWAEMLPRSILGRSPTKESKIRIGCLSHAFLSAQRWA